MKTRQSNYNTVFYVVEMNLFDGKFNKQRWIIRFLVPNSHSMRTSFLNFLQHFIRKVLVTDDVLSSIGAPELMEFLNMINHFTFTSIKIRKRRSIFLRGNANFGSLYYPTQRSFRWIRPIQRRNVPR